MPGNEVGDRIHNFFAQENISQGQHHSEIVDGSWTGLGNNPWVGGQRQIGTPFISNLKNQSGQQSVDAERGYGGQSSTVLHGMNFAHQCARSQSQNQQPTANGYMHGNQVFQASESNANLLGVDADNDRRNLTSRGFSVLDAQLGSGPEIYKKNSLRMDFNDAPINYDFLGSQQHMSNQHPGMLQSLPRQQSGISDMQLLQQQVMLNQMQEMQRQQQHQKQQLQQQESRQLNSANQVSSFAKQAAGGHSSAMVNGVPIHDASNYSWQPELMPTNSNWSQRVASPAMQGSSSGLIFSPEQGQAPRLMGMIPHQLDQSLHGVPISGTRISPNQYSPVQMEKPTIQQLSGSSNSFAGNHYAGFPDNSGMHDGTLVARQGYQGKHIVGSADTQDLNGALNLENLQQVDARQSNGPTQDHHRRQELHGSLDTPQEKTVMQVAPSENVATLDPTEEKILFGSDDNLWEAFGRSANVSAGGYVLDSGDVFGSFPSMQSGSWSALMQSAVAETSSADVGVQEEWSGLTFRNSEPPSGNQPSTNINDSVKQQSTWADNRLQSSSMSNARPYGISDGTNSNVSFNNTPGHKQSGVSPSNEKIERMHTSSSQRYVQPFSGEGTKWLDRKLMQKPVSEGVHNYEKSVHSLDADSNAKSVSGSWMNQQSIPSCNMGGQPSSKPNGWKFVDSVSPRAHTVLKNPGNENTFQASQSTERKNLMFEAMGYGAGLRKTDSVSNSLGLEQTKSRTGSPQVNREESSSNNAVFPESNTGRAHPESCQQVPNGNNIDVWKHVDPSANPKGRDFPGKHHPHMDMNHQTVESSGNCSYGNGVVETQDYSDTKESKTNSFRNVGLYNSTSGVRENAWLDASDSLTLSGAKGKPSNIVRKPSGIRKFQYHPMGDLDVDVEPSYTHGQSMLTQVSPGLKGQDHGGIRQPKFPAQMARNSMESDKGHFPGFQGDKKGLDETTLKNIVSGSAPSTSANFDTGAHNYATGRTRESSQNMLELLHKVDQSGEHGSATNFSPDCNQLSEMHEMKNSNGYIHLHQNQSATSQGFGLQLGPPAQLLPTKDRTVSSQSPSEVGEKSHTWLASTSSVQGLPLPHETSQGELRSKTSSTFGQTSKNTQGGNSPVAFSPGFPYPRSHLQNQHTYDAGGQATTNQSVNVFFDRLSTQSKQVSESFDRAQSSQSLASVPDMSGSTLLSSKAASGEMRYLSNNIQNNGKDSAPQFPVLESVTATQDSTVSGASQENSAKVAPNMWNSVSTQQHPFSAQHSQGHYNVFKSNNDSETTSSRLHKLEAQNVQMIGDVPSEIGATTLSSHGSTGKEQPAKGDSSQNVAPENDPGQNTMTVSQGAESAATCVPGTSISNFTSTQREIEAFGRSLRPDNFLHQNYSMHQVHGMRNAEVDPSNRSSKRFKGPDNSVDVQEVGQQFYDHNNMVRDASTAHAAKPTNVQDTDMSSQNVVTFGQNNSQHFSNSSVVSVRTEHSKISPQMAPSWFDQYGTFKNGQISPLADAQKIASMKTMDLPFNVGRPSSSLCIPSLVEQGNAVVSDAGQHGLQPKSSTPSSLASENLSSPQVTNLNVADVCLTVTRPKKRKTATSELVPWHEQLVHGLRILQNISSAESDWAHTVNRLTEKVEDDVEIADDGPLVYRSKRRLVITTQLMQLLFSPPAASVLSADAMSHYESVVHFLARSTVGDACSTLSHAGSDTPVPSSSGNILPEKLIKSEKISNQYFSKVVEDLISRARKLENDLLRLDKRASVLDLRVECQELEKYSVINRFAKFHGRAQADTAEMSSPDAPTNAQKSSLQRYVTAITMPKNLPDRASPIALTSREKSWIQNLLGADARKYVLIERLK